MAHRSQEIALGLRGPLDLTIEPGNRIVLQRRLMCVLKNLLPLLMQGIGRLDQKEPPLGYFESPSLQVYLDTTRKRL